MKKLYLFLMFTLLLLLGGCSRLTPSPHGEIPADELVKITTQYPVYAKDVKTISFMVENLSDDELFYGVDWRLEKHTANGWMTIPFVENAAFDLTGIQLAPGRMKSEILYLKMFDYSLTDGTYRIVKEINDQYYAGEFSVGDSPITDENPHGFVPLEKLPKKYSAEDALADGVVIRRLDGTLENADRIQPFFDQLAIGYDSQLRLGSFTDEGELVLTDLIAEGNDSFHKQTKICFRRDNSRANGSDIDQKYFHTLITDGEKIALSAAYGWLEEDNQRQEIVELNGDWIGREECLIAISENMKETESKTYWSPDGMIGFTVNLDPDYPLYTYDIDLHDYSEYYRNDIPVPQHDRIIKETLQQYKDSLATIREVLWSPDSKTAVFVCGASDGGSPWYFTYDVQKGQVTEIHHEPK